MATFDFSTLQGIPEQVGNLLFGVYPTYTEIELNSALTREGKNQAHDQLIGKVIAELDRLQQVAESEAERIQKQAEKILNGAQPDPQTAVLNELKAQRAWGRIRRKLDAFSEPSSLLRGIEDLIDQTARNGDRFTLALLREELPDYLAARRVNAPQVFDWLDQAEVPLLTPEQREARKALAVLEENYPRVQAAIDMGRRAAQMKSFKVAALPGWDDQTLHLNW
ncbi:hypothetical protein QYE77_00730 [Thermanaerothrix sp. 4228-RoL]|uniref:Uncharacterized protein n=1 Tax=Thermanaerothrix solaris TaxID=3058434 RepID=A0ABU3NIU7_9CHLR|nr:hypothetical protein [Thermanaerothrix sp. 4228-RoL]MDT8896774.1 hypothetical protein [Thermanaerothrix sp. 4228-RoL]